MGVLIDCRTETIAEHGKCVEGHLPTAEPDILEIAGVGFNAYQLAAAHVLFVMLLAIIVMIFDMWRINSK